MASIKYTGAVYGLKGSIQGSTFQGSKSGQVVKAKPQGIRRKVIKTGYLDAQNTKALLAFIAQRWRTLTDAQRSAWASAALDVIAYNRFGDTYTPSGYQLFMSRNIELQRIGGWSTTPVVPADPPSMTGLVLTISPEDLELVLDWDEAYPDSWTMEVQASYWTSKGKTAFNTSYKDIYFNQPDGLTTLNLWADYVATYGTPQAESRINIRVRNIDNGSGWYSAWYYLTVVVPTP